MKLALLERLAKKNALWNLIWKTTQQVLDKLPNKKSLYFTPVTEKFNSIEAKALFPHLVSRPINFQSYFFSQPTQWVSSDQWPVRNILDFDMKEVYIYIYYICFKFGVGRILLYSWRSWGNRERTNRRKIRGIWC